jgi:hypothetical protein
MNKLLIKNNWIYLLITIIVLYIAILFISPYPRYIDFLPSLYFYSNKQEANDVYELTSYRSQQNEKVFYVTDFSISNLFKEYVNENQKELDQFINSPKVVFAILFLKYIINRARPYQVNNKIVPLQSKTDKTPSYPAGHTFQSYYLAKKLGEMYPGKKDFFLNLSNQIDQARINAGIHYPSDGEFSRNIVDFLFKIGIY